MRNILTVLTLCVLTLTTSSVFAESYDESKRTERMGLSFYDGAPMYLLYFRRPDPLPPGSSFRDPIPGATMQVERLRSGERIEERDGYNVALGIVADKDSGSTATFISYAYDDAGNLVPMESGSTISNTVWIQSLFREQGPGLMALASTGDVAVDIFDVMLEPLSEMLRGWLGVVLAIGAVMFGWNFIRELSTLDFSGKSKGKNGKTSAPLSYAKLSRRDRSLYEDAALGSIGIESSQLLVPKEIKKDVDFVTGAAFGLKFDEKTRESNRLLMEMFNRLSSKEQKAILKAFRESAFDKSFEDSAEKRFLAYQGEVFDDVDNPFTGRSKRRAFDPLDAEVLSQGYGSEYVGWDVVSSAGEIDDANASLDEAYYDDNGGTPF